MLGNFFSRRKAVAGMLFLVIIFLGMLHPYMANAAMALEGNQIPIQITVGEQNFSAALYDNETTRAWVKQMPMTLDMSELNGNEKYYYLSKDLPTNSKKQSAIHTGDLMLYGSDCIVLFYQDFKTSYSYTPLGYMEDPAGLAKALGDKSVTVSFRLYDEEPADKEEDQQKQPEKTGQSESETVKVRTIKLSGDVTKLAQGKKAVLKASVLPQNASKKDLKWTSSNKEIATVSSKGIVTGKGKGTAAITAAATDGSGIKQTYRITVVSHAVKKITLSLPKGADLKSGIRKVKAGKKIKVTASVSTTGNAANKKLVWITSNPKYASVNSKGMVTAKKAGKGKTVTITAKATDGSGKKASIKIKIE